MNRETKLQTVAQFLMDTEQTNPGVGTTIDIIAKQTGLAKSTLYRIIDTSAAKKWGIFQANKKTQPYNYYVDTSTLVAYQTLQTGAAGVVAPLIFHDPDRQLVLEMMFKYLVKAVSNIQRVDFIKDNFARLIVEQSEETVMKQWPALTPGGKVLNGLLLAFQNIKE